MHNAAYAVVRCPSVWVSDTFVFLRAYIVDFFASSGIHVIRVFPHQTLCQYSHGDPSNEGVECRWGIFSTNISISRVLSTVRPSGVINRVSPDRGSW